MCHIDLGALSVYEQTVDLLTTRSKDYGASTQVGYTFASAHRVLNRTILVTCAVATQASHVHGGTIEGS